MIMIAGNDDISSLIGSVTWSGDKDQMARRLNFTYICTDQDKNVKSVDIPLGTRILMYDDSGKLKFDGMLVSITKDEADLMMSLACYDMAFYLKSKVFNTYKGTPGQIVKEVCSEFGIQTGTLADAGKKVKVVSTGEKTIYQVITSAYEDAGIKAHVYMDGLLLCTELFGEHIAAVLTGDDSITSAFYSSSIENLVDQVLIMDEKGRHIGMLQNEADIAAYGIIREIHKKKGDAISADEEAGKLLKSIANSGSITACVLDYECVTGRKVAVYKAGSSICGLFSIVSDNHTIADGVHKVKLGLDFEGVENGT